MSEFKIKRHDRYPSITATLLDGDGAAIDLSGCTVTFLMREQTAASLTVNAAATVVSAAAGTVRYDWLAADVDTAGRYYCEWQITYPDTKKMTVPTSGYDLVIIEEDLDNA
jgi:hypothetical protein